MNLMQLHKFLNKHTIGPRLISQIYGDDGRSSPNLYNYPHRTHRADNRE